MDGGIFDTRRLDRLNHPGRIKELRPEELLRDIAHLSPGMTAVDMGSGTGVFALPMARIVGSDGKVYAVDRSSDMINALKSAAPPVNLFAILADVESTGIESETADLCLVALVLHELSSPIGAIREARRLLRPGGRIVVVEWKMEIDWGPPASAKISKQTVEGLFLQAGFTFDEYVDWSRSYYVMLGTRPRKVRNGS